MNLVYVLNVNTFAKEAEIHIGGSTSTCLSGVAHNPASNQYFVVYGTNILKCNNLFNVMLTFPMNPKDITVGAFQNIEYYNEKIYLLYYDKIIILDYYGNYITNISTDVNVESEGIVVFDDTNILIGTVHQQTSATVKNQVNLVNIYDCNTDTGTMFREDTVKLNTGITCVSNINTIKRNGKNVYCHVCVKSISSIPCLIGTIPKEFCPEQSIRVIGACAGVNYARFEINPNGEIYIYATTISNIGTNSWFELSLAYMLN